MVGARDREFAHHDQPERADDQHRERIAERQVAEHAAPDLARFRIRRKGGEGQDHSRNEDADAGRAFQHEEISGEEESLRPRSEENTSEHQSLKRRSYDVLSLKKKIKNQYG